jgi:hypothetical protein
MESNRVKRIIWKEPFGMILKINGLFERYRGGGYISRRIAKDEIQKKPDIIETLKKEGYTKFTVYTKEETERDLEYNKVVDYMNNYSKNGIVTLRYLNRSQIDEFFDFDIAIQIENEIVNNFYTLIEDDENTRNYEYVTFTAYTSINNSLSEAQKKEIAEMDRLFGEHYKTNNWHQSDQWRNPYEYRVHVSKIEKIILTKYFKDIDSIGTERQGLRNGKTEVLELDLRNPDMEIYEKMRAIDNCIEIEWEKE